MQADAVAVAVHFQHFTCNNRTSDCIMGILKLSIVDMTFGVFACCIDVLYFSTFSFIFDSLESTASWFYSFLKDVHVSVNVKTCYDRIILIMYILKLIKM